MMSKGLLNSTGLLVAGLLFVLVNIFSLAALKHLRIDLTENSLYTLTEGTENIISELEEPVTLRFYLSRKMASRLPGINSYATRVRELLEEYERGANGNIKLAVIDPEPFSEEEDRAVAYGLQGVPVGGVNELFYFGMVGTGSTDEEEVIPFFQPNREEFLEYDITQLVYRLSSPEKKTVGIMSPLAIRGDTNASPFSQNPNPPWMILDHIKKLFDVKDVAVDVEEIPSDVDILMLVHPKDLAEKTLYAIDQFVLAGGRAMVFVDPYSEIDEPPPTPGNPMAALQAPRASRLAKLFNQWGVNVAKGKVAADMKSAKRVQMNRGGRGVVVDYPIWMDLKENNFNENDIITNNLASMTFASAGVVSKDESVKTEFIPLIQTSEKSKQIDASELGFMFDPQSLLRGFVAEGKSTLAARITGAVKTAFPNGAPEEKSSDSKKEDAKKPKKTHLSESVEPVNLIVVADTDMLTDKFWVQVQNFLGRRIAIPTAANGTFVVNALDNLSGSSDLISVRNRGGFSRPFTRIKEIQQAAEQEFLEKEQKLQERLKTTEAKLQSLQREKGQKNMLIMTAKEQAEVSKFRQEKVKIRKELRNVQHGLRSDIEQLGQTLKFINIGLVPILIALAGILVAFLSSKRRRLSQQKLA